VWACDGALLRKVAAKAEIADLGEAAAALRRVHEGELERIAEESSTCLDVVEAVATNKFFNMPS
jgi:hypothetical protein